MTLHTIFKSLLATGVFLTIFLIGVGCGGTHGGVINYCYNINHKTLDSALRKVLHDNTTIRQDTFDHGGYNKGDYFVLLVDKFDGTYQYNFRYYGDSTMWRQDSLNSCMFIWAMYDPKNRGGWDKDFGISNQKLKKELLEVIQDELILKIDREIGKSHMTSK